MQDNYILLGSGALAPLDGTEVPDSQWTERNECNEHR